MRVVCSLATQHELEYWTPTLFDYRDKRQLYTKMTVAWHSVNATVAKRLPTIILSISFFKTMIGSKSLCSKWSTRATRTISLPPGSNPNVVHSGLVDTKGARTLILMHELFPALFDELMRECIEEQRTVT